MMERVPRPWMGQERECVFQEEQGGLSGWRGEGRTGEGMPEISLHHHCTDASSSPSGQTMTEINTRWCSQKG